MIKALLHERQPQIQEMLVVDIDHQIHEAQGRQKHVDWESESRKISVSYHQIADPTKAANQEDN